MNRYLLLFLGAFSSLTPLSSAEDNPASRPALPGHQGPHTENLKGAVRASTQWPGFTHTGYVGGIYRACQ